MRTDRTNRIARGRGEVTSGNGESAEMRFEGDTDCGAGEGAEAWLQRRARESAARRHRHKEQEFPKLLAGEKDRG